MARTVRVMTDNASDVTLTKREDVPAGWYVEIHRQYSDAPLAVGPYPSKEIADSAFSSSLLIDSFCEEDCLDAYLVPAEELSDEVELNHIDPNDPNHHGPEHPRA